MNSDKNNEAIRKILGKLDRLSELEVDFLNYNANQSIISPFDDLIETCSSYIEDTEIENGLLEEFLTQKKRHAEILEDKVQNAHQSYNELELELQNVQAEHQGAVNVLKQCESLHCDIEELQQKKESKERLAMWKHSCDLESLEIRALKCKLDELEGKLSFEKTTSPDSEIKYRLFYSFITSALKTTILSIDDQENVNLAILSESEKNEHVWHRLSYSLRTADVSTCDFLWNIIQKSLSSQKLQSIPCTNTPKIDSYHLSSP
ncbi:hypothetical protein BEWA_025160 [Theileria equi strain WA]|uniref:Kinetochore protein SPC25 n=1 Tax=Theileria equi strain WA TaxID=1537102 RepID=L0AVN1_THEEQ|nr:hypothetical protein BEWA_025160 [Theileria equi strain WA]AFZ79667.1 hypothetical protein BEWA_025160 [Theileria equi strain WA]|eukprot:XP_004829333.1 hypothetical protein BEWA_025160 [Theileria equi strain WA]